MVNHYKSILTKLLFQILLSLLLKRNVKIEMTPYLFVFKVVRDHNC